MGNAMGTDNPPDLEEGKKNMKANINPQQYEILKRCLVGWGKKEEEVDGFIEEKANEYISDNYKGLGKKIQTDTDGNITVLDLRCHNWNNLHINKLSGEIPSRLGELKNLTTLDLSSNELSGPIPSWLGELKNLEELDLHINKLSGEIPSSLGNLKALKYVNLRRNQLSGEIPSELGGLKALRRFDVSFNPDLSGTIPAGWIKYKMKIEGTHIFIISVTVKTKPVNTLFEKFMTIQYIVLGYADLVTDIIVIIQLFNSVDIYIGSANLFFIILGMVLGYWNSDRSLKSLFLNVTQLSILVDGFETLRKGHQTDGLVLGKKLDAICRSMPSVILQLYALLKDLEKYPATSRDYITFVLSITFAIFGASFTLSASHRKAGNKLFSWQFVVVNLYYFAEILLRCLMIGVAFISVGAYAFIAAAVDMFLRYMFQRGMPDEGEFDDPFYISLFFLYSGSDNALDYEGRWFLGSFLTFIETVIFTIVMLTLETDDLHTMRSRGTAYNLTYIMIGAFIAKTKLYYYIEKKMADPVDKERESEVVENEMHQMSKS